MHDRAFLGSSYGYWRRSLRHRIRHDEYGGKLWWRPVANCLWRPGSVRIVASAIHCCSEPSRSRCRDLGILAGSKYLGCRKKDCLSEGISRSEPISSSLARSRRLNTPSDTNRPGAKLFDVEIELMRELEPVLNWRIPKQIIA